MKKIISSSLAVVALGFAANSVIASDFSDDINDLKSSIKAIEKQLDSMDVNYNKVSLETGLNRTQELRALETQYKDLKSDFNNAYFAN
jgi:archaellum component FlaC